MCWSGPIVEVKINNTLESSLQRVLPTLFIPPRKPHFSHAKMLDKRMFKYSWLTRLYITSLHTNIANASSRMLVFNAIYYLKVHYIHSYKYYTTLASLIIVLALINVFHLIILSKYKTFYHKWLSNIWKKEV